MHLQSFADVRSAMLLTDLNLQGHAVSICCRKRCSWLVNDLASKTVSVERSTWNLLAQMPRSPVHTRAIA